MNQSKLEIALKVTGIELRCDCRKLFSSTEHECILAGPADTGKTFACCLKAHVICALIPKVQGVIVRKTYKALAETVLQTFIRLIAGQGVQILGGSTPSRFIYPNGSVIWVIGMDDPGKVLSSERDFIYVNQCEELTLADWEMLTTRCSGRAAVVEFPQIFGDCNPAGSRHWILERAASGKLRLLNATHRDNPELYDESGNVTQDGRRRLAVLENLTGVRRARLYEGKWVTAEGTVYEMFDVNIHQLTRNREEMKRWLLAIDEGYTHPAVILMVGEDSDGRWHVFKEFYKRGVMQANVVATAKEWALSLRSPLLAVDASAAGLIADLRAAGMNAVGGKGRVLDGIQAIQNRLKVQGDGKPRLTVDPACENLINEFQSYVWRPEKDVPVKEFDHALDALRYLHDVLAVPTGAISSVDDLVLGPGRPFSTRVFIPRRFRF
jgi:phage terminase large subunit